MSVGTKKIAISGLLAAFSVAMLVLSSTIETSTLFFLAAASFTVGITIREWGVKFGAAYWVASSLLNLLVAPNKFYCMTFAAMGLYILLSEYIWERIADNGYMAHRMTLLWLGKYLIFNAMYVPVVIFLGEILLPGQLEKLGIAIVLLIGQPALFVYDYAYRYFQSAIWGRIRIKLIG